MKRAYLTLLAIALLSVPALGQTPQKIANINRKIVGKWVSADKKSYIEFLANGSCADGELFPDGKWHVDQNTLGAWEQGEDFSCGSGDLTLISPNMLVRDYGMGGRPEKFYRGAGNMPKPVGSLTMLIARRVLNEQINQTMVDNTLLTCHACYDPSDKADNDKAVVVSTYSPSINQFLMEHGYIRAVSNQQGYTEVFTAKAKRSKDYAFNDGVPGFRFANFRNPRILTTTIADPHHIPIEYELVPTEVTAGFFGKPRVVKSFVSISYENDMWSVCIACSR